MKDMRPVFADPKTDLVFKRIFGDESRKDLLIALLDSLLGLEREHRIADIEYLTPEQVPRVAAAKLSILDVRCTDRRGTRYVVEMQVLSVEGFEKRVVYNACKAYAGQLAAGDDYPQLNDVVAVTICDFALWPERPAGAWEVPMLSRWAMREDATGARRLGQVRYVFLELAKYEAGDAPASTVEKWAYFFRETKRLKAVPSVLAGSPYQRALEVARASGFTPEEWEIYDREKIAEADARGAIRFAQRQGREEGLRSGMDEGLRKGRDEGRAEGRREGLIEGLERLCGLLGLDLTPARRRSLEALDAEGLRQLADRLAHDRAWE
jgi:predicted transposase/invertase (TIGR01784 family)